MMLTFRQNPRLRLQIQNTRAIRMRTMLLVWFRDTVSHVQNLHLEALSGIVPTSNAIIRLISYAPKPILLEDCRRRWHLRLKVCRKTEVGQSLILWCKRFFTRWYHSIMTFNIYDLLASCFIERMERYVECTFGLQVNDGSRLFSKECYVGETIHKR